MSNRTVLSYFIACAEYLKGNDQNSDKYKVLDFCSNLAKNVTKHNFLFAAVLNCLTLIKHRYFMIFVAAAFVITALSFSIVNLAPIAVSCIFACSIIPSISLSIISSIDYLIYKSTENIDQLEKIDQPSLNEGGEKKPFWNNICSTIANFFSMLGRGFVYIIEKAEGDNKFSQQLDNSDKEIKRVYKEYKFRDAYEKFMLDIEHCR